GRFRKPDACRRVWLTSCGFAFEPWSVDMIASDDHHLLSYQRGRPMKRIIGGVTYNTATATVLARSQRHDPQENVERELTLYQTSGGAFFLDRATTHHRHTQTGEDRLIGLPNTL